MSALPTVLRVMAAGLMARDAGAALPDEERPLVRRVELRGVKSVDRDALADGPATRATKCRSLIYSPICLLSRSPVFATRKYLVPEEVRRDELRIRIFYWKRGFRDTKVSSAIARAKNGVRVRFDVEEGTPTIADSIAVKPVASVLPARTIATTLQLRPGDPLDLVLLDSTRLHLRRQGDSVPLSPLGDVIGVVREIFGAARGDVTIGGTWDDPTFTGRMRVQLDQARIVPTGILLHDVVAAVRMKGDTMHVDSLSARSGGIISATGQVIVADLMHPRLQLAMRGARARILDDTRGSLTADGDVRIEGALDTLTVRGRVAITHGVVYFPEPETYDIINTTDPAIFAVTDTSGARALDVELPSPMRRNLQLQLTLEVQRGTFARSPDANIEVYGNLEVRKEAGAEDYAVSGALYTDQGDYTYLGKRFDVSRGSVRFVGTKELNPVLQVVAVYEVRQAGRAPLDIRIVIGGTLEHPTLALSSESQPTLSQSDLISFMAFGKSSSSLLQFFGTGLEGGGPGGSALAGNVAAVASRQLASIGLGALAEELRSDLAGATRADVLRVTPAELPADLSLGAVQTILRGTEIEIGKYLDHRTFLIGRIRPTLVVPGATLERRLSDRLRLRTTLETRFLPSAPTLSAGLAPRTLQVIGALLTWSLAW